MILPSTFQWKDQMAKINATNAAFGLKEVSTLNLSKIRSTRFPEFDVKKPGDNFARCAKCDKLNELIKGSLSRSISNLKWRMLLVSQLRFLIFSSLSQKLERKSLLGKIQVKERENSKKSLG